MISCSWKSNSPKRASCERNGRVIAAWLVQHVRAFSGLAFWQCLASLAAHGCSTLPLLFVSAGLYVPGTRRKLHLCHPDFTPATQHAAQWTLWNQERQCSFRDYTAHVFFVGLLSAAGRCNSSWLCDAALVVHVVDRILLEMLQCIEDVKICISELQLVLDRYCISVSTHSLHCSIGEYNISVCVSPPIPIRPIRCSDNDQQ